MAAGSDRRRSAPTLSRDRLGFRLERGPSRAELFRLRVIGGVVDSVVETSDVEVTDTELGDSVGGPPDATSHDSGPEAIASTDRSGSYCSIVADIFFMKMSEKLNTLGGT